jgi:hypothetical protein
VSVPPAVKNKAIKLLTQYERLARKYNVALPPARLADLNRLRDCGDICAGDLPATIRREFPPQLAGFSLQQIRNLP